MKQENINNCMKMGVAMVLMFEAIIFFILYQQMPTSLNLFAVNNVNPSFFGINIDPQSFQAAFCKLVGTLFYEFMQRIVALSPLVFQGLKSPLL